MNKFYAPNYPPKMVREGKYLWNLKDLIKFSPYPIWWFADAANIEVDLLEAVLEGEEKLTEKEVYRIAWYTNVQPSVLLRPDLIVLDKKRLKHKQMMAELANKKLYDIWYAEKDGSAAAINFMRTNRAIHQAPLVNMNLAFHNGYPVSYCRYLGIKTDVEMCLREIEREKREKNKSPRRGRVKSNGSQERYN